MTAKEKLYVEKLEEYIEFSDNMYLEVPFADSKERGDWVNLRSDLIQLKSELKEERSGLKKFNESEWVDPLWKRDQDVKEVVKEEQSMSAENVLMKIYGHKKPLTGERLTVFLDRNADMIQAMHSFRDQRRDWEKIEKEFQVVVNDLASDYDEKSNYKAIQRAGKEFFNWFKSKLKLK